MKGTTHETFCANEIVLRLVLRILGEVGRSA